MAGNIGHEGYSVDDIAISIHDGSKVYWTWQEEVGVFKDFNFTVRKGSLYALLGESGCGKSTILKCIVGREKLTTGNIWVLGGCPGSKESAVPGPRIGYLPQEEGLYNEFSIFETFLYFGWICGMNKSRIQENGDALMNALQLPHYNTFIKNLSGGEKKRVSLAVSLLHEPELLILDEPTVGLDLLLRESIWNLLLTEVRERGTTVLLTTHYIEEARQASIIGLIRNEELIAEDVPDNLLQRFQTDSLEDAFLCLISIQEENKNSERQESTNGIDVYMRNKRKVSSWKNPSKLFRCRNIKALVWKNSLWLRRSVWMGAQFVFFAFILTVLINNTIGIEPNGLNVAVHNGEYPGKASCPFTNNCISEGLSCRFLLHLNEIKQIIVVPKERVSGIDAVRSGKAWAFIEIPRNFSKAYFKIVEYGLSKRSTISGSRIDVTMDMSSYVHSHLLTTTFVRTFKEFSSDLAKSCGIPSRNLQYFPIKFEKPLYGLQESSNKAFCIPGLMIVLAFILMVSLSSDSLLLERREGIWGRSFVSGVTSIEVVISHYIVQLIIIMVSSLIIVILTLFLFEAENNGSVMIIYFLIAMAASVGTCYGTLISVIFTNLWLVMHSSVSSFTAFCVLSGVYWPIQGQHFLIKPFGQFAPLTFTIESLRSVMIKGMGLENPSVYYGFIITGLWIIIIITATIIAVKFKIK